MVTLSNIVQQLYARTMQEWMSSSLLRPKLFNTSYLLSN